MCSGGARVKLFLVGVFVALTAIGGDIALVAGLEANTFPLEMLPGTPFGSYVIPGLILVVVVSGSAAVAAAATLLSPGVGALASTVAGVGMMGCIVGGVLLFNQPSAWTWIEVFYFALGLVMVVLGLIVGRT
ncbi:MAG: hypothetical protein K0S10_1631 [Rubrobacteraceae bacterium]|jgi:hypothetical protein|nr:hypothetical protein [Rubrobacteraceae bacterium]